jgi:hypothetical protein
MVFNFLNAAKALVNRNKNLSLSISILVSFKNLFFEVYYKIKKKRNDCVFIFLKFRKKTLKKLSILRIANIIFFLLERFFLLPPEDNRWEWGRTTWFSKLIF